MVKKYSVEQIKQFARGYDLYNSHYTDGNDSYVQGSSTFTINFANSLRQLYSLVSSDNYNSWNRTGDKSFHNWLGYEYSSKKFVYNCGTRTDDWAMSLVDSLLEEYDPNSLEEWFKFVDTQEYKDNVRVIASYYSPTSYFNRLCRKVDLREVLTIKEYKKFCENTYAQKVLHEYRSVPKFTVGSIVDFRSSHEEHSDEYGMQKIWKRSAKGLMILSNTERIVNARKGAKRYKVVAIGDTVPFYIEEAFLKKRKKTLNKT